MIRIRFWQRVCVLVIFYRKLAFENDNIGETDVRKVAKDMKVSQSFQNFDLSNDCIGVSVVEACKDFKIY